MPASPDSSPEPDLGLEAFLRGVANAQAKDVGVLQRRAREFLRAVLESRQVDPTAEHRSGRGVYDSWVLELFRATEAAAPRDALLRDFVSQFAKVHNIGANGGPWIVVIEGEPPHGGEGWTFNGTAQAGMQSALWDSFRNDLRNVSDDPILLRTFAALDQDPIDLWYLPYFRGTLDRGLFDRVIGNRARRQGPATAPNVWMAVQRLLDDRGRVSQAVFILYPNRGSLFEINQPPHGAAQDRRVLDILAAVYRQLSTLVRQLATDAERNKRDLLAQLGPGLLHHEIGGGVRNLTASLAAMSVLGAALRERYSGLPPEAEALLDRVALAQEYRTMLESTTDAFNTLERRGEVQLFPFDRLLEQVARLVQVRCGQVGARLERTATIIELRNDQTLILAALLNLVTNALNAIEESKNYDVEKVIRLRVSERGESVFVDVANTGPPLPDSMRTRLFQRGATTRAQGHGQGLFLVRRIAQYCGGDAELVSVEERVTSSMEDETVVFRLSLAKSLDTSRELDSAA